MKLCTSCGLTKEYSDFYRNAKAYGDGYLPHCKTCRINASAKRNKTPEVKKKRSDAAKAKILTEQQKQAKRLSYKRWYEKEESKKKVEERRRQRDAENPLRAKQIQRKSYLNNSECPAFRLSARIRVGLRKSLKTGRSAKTFELLQFSIEELKTHIEKQFVQGMGWHNMHEWHIDHIIPLSAFPKGCEKSAISAWRLSNLRPFWAWANVRKSDKIEFLL